jgi:hypothetical protein
VSPAFFEQRRNGLVTAVTSARCESIQMTEMSDEHNFTSVKSVGNLPVM